MPSLDQLLAKSIPELKERFVDRERAVPGLMSESDPRQARSIRKANPRTLVQESR
jgi:hypothetical protein